MYIDNQAVKNRIDDATENETLPNPMDSEFTYFEMIAQMSKKLKYDVEWNWVRSHQEDGEGTGVRLNQWADILAEQYRKDASDPPEINQLEINPPLLLIDCKQVNANYKEIIHQAATDREYQAYIQGKWKWNTTDFDMICWGKIAEAYKKFRPAQQVQITKMMHKWTNVGSQKNKIHGTEVKCPICTTENENEEHIFYCKKQIHSLALQNLNRRLKKIHTTQPVKAAINKILRNGEAQTVVVENTIEEFGNIAMNRQSHLGRTSLARGYICKSWRKAQDKTRAYDDNNKMNPNWETKTIIYIWKYYLQLWEYRNTIMHGSNNVKKELVEKAKNIVNLAQFGLCQCDDFLLDPSLIQFDQQSAQIIRTWCRMTNEAMKKYKTVCNKEDTRQQKMTAYFPRTREEKPP